MGSTRNLASAIREFVSVNGLDKTQIAISKILSEFRQGMPSSYNCNYCKGELVPSSSIRRSLVMYSCDSCDNELVVYHGTARTKRRSTDPRGYWPKVTIRCFDEDRKERVLECRFSHRANVTDIEMKSGDKFSIMFFRINNDLRGIRAEIENFTVKKEASAIVSLDELVQFAESMSIAEDSYLTKLPDTLVPPA